MKAQASGSMRDTTRPLIDGTWVPEATREVVRRRPWWCLGAAMAGGILCGLRLGRTSPTQQEPQSTAAATTWTSLRNRLGGVMTTMFGAWLFHGQRESAAPAAAAAEQSPASQQS